MKYIFSCALAVVVVLVAVTFVSEGVMTEGTAVASRVEGTASIAGDGSSAGRPISANDSIAKNDRVETQASSRLELRLPDGGCLRLSENTQLTVQELRFEKKTGTQYLQVVLHKGRLWAQVKKRAMPESRSEVLTGAGLAAGKEAVYAVNADDAGSTINVYEGTVRAASAARNAPAHDRTDAPAETAQAGLDAMQQVFLPAREATQQQQRAFDLKAGMDEWTRWNLQRDAREGLLSITVAPALSTITRGASLQFAASARYPDNVEKDVASFATWSSSDARVAQIDPFGSAAGKEVGAATITAAIDDMSGSTVLNVSREVVSIKVTPASGSVMNGAAQQFTAIGTFSDRTVRDITASAVWRSSNSNVALVDAAGRAVGGNSTGTAVITASLGTRSGSARLKVRRELVSIAVLPESAIIIPGDTQRFGAIGAYSDKSTQDITGLVEWDTSDLHIAVMDQEQPGRVLGQDPGNAAITATFKNRSGSATITVEALPRR